MNTIGNRGGIPFVTATQTDAGSTTTNAVYSLPNHVFRFLGNVGLIIVNVPTATATTVTGITVTCNSQDLSLLTNTNTTPTSLSVGDYLVEFNKVNNTLKYFA
jgi:hypothetical protein